MKYCLFLLTSLILFFAHAQENQSLNTYTFAEAEQLQEEEERPYFIFIHTDWCRYCLGMRNNVFTNPSVIKILNKSFYLIIFNAENEEDVFFSGRSFLFKPNGKNTGIHELADALGNIDGKLTFPSSVILLPKNEITFQYGGFIPGDELLELLETTLSK